MCIYFEGGRLFTTIMLGGQDGQPYGLVYEAINDIWLSMLRCNKITNVRLISYRDKCKSGAPFTDMI